MPISEPLSSLFKVKESLSHHATGPRTAAGIENCKYNATRHGLTGNQVVIKGEDPAEYDALRRSLVEEHQPASEDQAMLVEVIAQTWWKRVRADRYERDLFEHSRNEDIFTSQCFINFMRYRAAIERAWNRARRELTVLKAAAQAAHEAATVAAATQGNTESKPSLLVHKVGSVIAAESVSYFDAPLQSEPLNATRNSGPNGQE